MLINFLKRQKILLLIILFASILRIWNLGELPPHLRNDEAALGYNAYSIFLTGKDEHGDFLPIIFQSFGDFKMGLYVYLTVPFIAALGLNEFSVRLPSVLFGIASVLLMYGVCLELLREKRVAILSAVLLSISPLFLPFSRSAWEVNVSFALTLAGIYFFLKSLRGNQKLLIVSAIFWGLTLITSQGAKFSTPVIILFLILVFLKEIRKLKLKIILLSFFVVFLFGLPVLLSFKDGKVARLTTLSIFSHPRDISYVDDVLKEGNETRENLSFSLYHSEQVFLARSIIWRWLSLYTFNSFFVSGDGNPQHGAPNVGPFLLLDSILLFLGIIKLSKMGFSKSAVFLWLCIFFLPMPSALTIEKPNFERILTFFMPLIIILAIGLDYLLDKLKKQKVLMIVIIVLYSINYLYFLDQYFIHQSKKNNAWQYGYKQIVQKVTPLQSKYESTHDLTVGVSSLDRTSSDTGKPTTSQSGFSRDKQIVVSQSLEEPYIFFLFYQKYNPSKYQGMVKEIFIPNKEGKDMGQVFRLDNIFFEQIDWLKKKPEKGTLFVMSAQELEKQAKYNFRYKLVDEIKDLNGFPLFKMVEMI